MNYPYAARIDITFPTDGHVEHAMQVLQVDNEPGDRVVKTFSIVVPEGDAREGLPVLRV
jgi:hypothetical protein